MRPLGGRVDCVRDDFPQRLGGEAVANRGQPDVNIEIEELIGAALRVDGCEKEPAEPAGGGALSVTHVWRDWSELRDMTEIGWPSPPSRRSARSSAGTGATRAS